MGFFFVLSDVEKEKNGDVPNHLKDPSRDGNDLGHGKGYLYPHAYKDHFVAQQYLPDALKNADYYREGVNKAEQQAREYWKRIKGSPS